MRTLFAHLINLATLILVLPLALPLMLVIALIIAAETPGPIIYRRYRIGKNGQRIPVFKFRTMYLDADERLQHLLEDPDLKAEWERYHKLSNDPRITRSGRWLRKTSLDELPQLFNVLLGQMNIIGPRPAFANELALYPPIARKAYLSVKPGITGLWQVKGRSQLPFKKRMALDACYVLCWSPCLDLWILWRTLFVVFAQTGAR